MLRHPTLATLEALKLTGMATALAEQLAMPEIHRLSFEERLGLLVDRERTIRDNHRLARRLAQARFPGSATLEDLDYRHPRGLDQSVIASLATGQWIRSHDNVLIVGPTGAGKTYLACALAQWPVGWGSPPCICDCRGSSETSRSPKAMAVMGVCSGVSPRPTSWSWMSGDWPP
jgi:DNA replication protein DnaC